MNKILLNLPLIMFATGGLGNLSTVPAEEKLTIENKCAGLSKGK